MTGFAPFARRQVPTAIPRGEVLVTVDSYPEAQSVVNRLTQVGYSVSNIAIVGRDLVTIERVTGRLTYARVAARGALNGAWFGLFAGLMLGALSTSSESFVLPAVIAIGAGVGMLIGLATYGARRRQHDYSSVQQVLASRYEVIVPAGTGDAARSALESAPPNKS